MSAGPVPEQGHAAGASSGAGDRSVRPMRARLHACLELTKPGITLFIGVSAAAGFLLAEGRWARPGTLALALLATMSMSGGAAALNQLVERDADARMRRTARRPLPAGILTPRQAGAFGWGLSLAGLVLSLALLPWAATLFLVLSHLSYVYLYTPLKRRTPLCTLAGAIPGALPAVAAERPAPGRGPSGPASAAPPAGGHRFLAAARNAP